jgi:hypothetical protein
MFANLNYVCQLSIDLMSVDQISVDQMSVDQMPVDQMSADQSLSVKRLSAKCVCLIEVIQMTANLNSWQNVSL